MSTFRPRHRITRLGIVAAGAALIVVAATLIGITLSNDSPALSAATSTPHGPAQAVCGQPVLKSPFSYDGAAGNYSSGAKGLPTYGTLKSDFPADKAGVVIAPGTKSFFSYDLKPFTVYYLEPGVHVGSFMADSNDSFVGGNAAGKATVLSGQNEAALNWAIDSNPTDGDQPSVTVQYLTIEKYRPNPNAAAINVDSNTSWHIKDNVITLNVPGAGVILGAGGILVHNCMTLNGQYGFQSEDTDAWGKNSLTGGPYDITVEDNEISYNDTCDFEGKLTNSAIGWNGYDPVPAKYQNPNCGTVVPDGDQGGFKLWETNNVTVADNYIHNNWGPGAWVDTNNANTTITDNTISANDDQAVIEEVSYNFLISGNYMAGNDLVGGLGNSGFPQPAIYISESGSDTTFGGVPGKYKNQSIISNNTLVNNGGSVFLWQNSNRYCSDGPDSSCTLVDNGSKGPFTVSACSANLPTASANTKTLAGNKTGSPAEDWADGCLWRTENVSVTKNVIDFNPADIPDCTKKDWSECGAGGVYSEYGSPPNKLPGWVIPTEITFAQHNVWSDNVYDGPSTFYAWSQGNGYNPVTWTQWTGAMTNGDECGSTGERASGFCEGPFGQDKGSTYTGRT